MVPDHMYTHTHVHSHTRTRPRTRCSIRTGTHARTRTKSHTHTHTHTHTRMQRHTRTHMHTHARTHTHTHLHAHMHTYFDAHTGRVKGDSMVKVWTTRSQNNTRHGQHATGTQHRCWHSDINTQTICCRHVLRHEQITNISMKVSCTHSKQGRARGQRARAANKGKGVAHRLVADAWLAEDSKPTS